MVSKSTILFLGAVVSSSALALPGQHSLGPVSDDTITGWIQLALAEDPRVNPEELAVHTVHGIVTLSGRLRNLAEQRYATLEAKKIKGVRGVIDRLEVLPGHRPDADLRLDVLRRLDSSSSIGAFGLRVAVVDGEAALDGRVASWTEKQHAGLLASEVRGIRRVRNNLEIWYKTPRSDGAIQQDVLATLGRDPCLVGLAFKVWVHTGIVTLRGEVGSAFQRERAGGDAWVRNVTAVHNKLELGWAKERGVRSSVAWPSDQELADAVNDELELEFRLTDPFGITVSAHGGQVVLRGKVPTFYQKQLAEHDAYNVIGVTGVTNFLTADAVERDDVAITRDLEFELESDYLLASQAVELRVQGGVVWLVGEVNTYFERDHAGEMAARVWGVRDVKNSLIVNASARYADESLRFRIAERLASNSTTRGVAARIKVTVRRREATLSGTVDSWLERSEAGWLAFQTDGVRVMKNRLDVNGVPFQPQDELRAGAAARWHEVWVGSDDTQMEPSSRRVR